MNTDHWLELAARARRHGRLEDTVQASRRAVEQAPGNAQAWSELAHALRLAGHLAEARAAAARAIEMGPRLASAWFNWGAVLLAQGATAQSVEANRKALELDPILPRLGAISVARSRQAATRPVKWMPIAARRRSIRTWLRREAGGKPSTPSRANSPRS